MNFYNNTNLASELYYHCGMSVRRSLGFHNSIKLSQINRLKNSYVKLN